MAFLRNETQTISDFIMHQYPCRIFASGKVNRKSQLIDQMKFKQGVHKTVRNEK